MKTILLLTVLILPMEGTRAAPGDEWQTTLQEVRPLLQQARAQVATGRLGAAQQSVQQALAILRRTRQEAAHGPFASAAQDLEESLQRALKASHSTEREALLRRGWDQMVSLETVIRGSPAPETRHQEGTEEFRIILASKEFQRAREDFWGRWLNRILRVILDFLARLFPVLQGGAKAARVAMWIVGLFLFALLSFLVAYGLTVLLRHLSARSRREQEGEGSDRVFRPGERPTPEALLAQAERQAGNGEFREALRLVFQAVLLLLDRRNVVEFDESRTNGEYQQSLREQPDPWWPERFAQATDLFEQKWYGLQATTATDYHSLLSYYQEVWGKATP